MAIIKDMCNSTAPIRGLDITDIVGGAPTSDIPVSNIGALSSSMPSIYSQQAIGFGRLYINPTLQFKEIMRRLLLYVTG